MVLKVGSMGPDVQRLTEALVGLKLLTEAGPIYNKDVAAAVQRFQATHYDARGHSLVQDGEFGPLTEWSFDQAMSGLPSPVILPTPQLAVPASGGSVSGRNALAAALVEYEAGAGEIDDDNCGHWVEKYQHHNRALRGQSWCASFVSWCFEEGNGGVSPFGYSAGARDNYDRFKRRGWIYAASAEQPPEPGDVIFWWRGTIGGWKGHIGIVQSYDNGFVRTIEGNKGDPLCKVATFEYVLGRINRLLGFGRAQP